MMLKVFTVILCGVYTILLLSIFSTSIFTLKKLHTKETIQLFALPSLSNTPVRIKAYNASFFAISSGKDCNLSKYNPIPLINSKSDISNAITSPLPTLQHRNPPITRHLHSENISNISSFNKRSPILSNHINAVFCIIYKNYISFDHFILLILKNIMDK